MWLKLIDEVIEDIRYIGFIYIFGFLVMFFSLNCKIRRVFRIVFVVCLKSEFELVKFFKRLLMGGVFEFRRSFIC